jgi:hypothetical protein
VSQQRSKTARLASVGIRCCCLHQARLPFLLADPGVLAPPINYIYFHLSRSGVLLLLLLLLQESTALSPQLLTNNLELDLCFVNHATVASLCLSSLLMMSSPTQKEQSLSQGRQGGNQTPAQGSRASITTPHAANTGHTDHATIRPLEPASPEHPYEVPRRRDWTPFPWSSVSPYQLHLPAPAAAESPMIDDNAPGQDNPPVNQASVSVRAPSVRPFASTAPLDQLDPPIATPAALVPMLAAYPVARTPLRWSDMGSVYDIHTGSLLGYQPRLGWDPAGFDYITPTEERRREYLAQMERLASQNQVEARTDAAAHSNARGPGSNKEPIEIPSDEDQPGKR